VVLCPDALCFEERQDPTGILENGEYERFEFLRQIVRGRSLAWKSILDMKKAIDVLSDWIASNPNDYSMQMVVAQEYQKLGQLSNATQIMEAVLARITSYTLNQGEEIGLEGQYEKIGGGPVWSLVKETGPASRLAMFKDGVNAYAALVAEKPDGSFVYVLGRGSVWVPFDIPKLFKTLNEIEADIITEGNMWGGSDTIGGSPRMTGSRLKPEELQKIINDTLGAKK